MAFGIEKKKKRSEILGRQEFIKTVGNFARNEYINRDRWILPSVCIAQAALESGFNLNASTLFGIKGAGVSSLTSEFYNGTWVKVLDSFRYYPTIAASVKGYYDFLTTTPRYKKALNETDYKKAVDGLINTVDGAPYATDPNYIRKITSLIETYHLTEWDKPDSWYGGNDYAAVYNRTYYNSRYPDLQSAFHGDPDSLIRHFVNYGMREGRQASKGFNVNMYRENYADLRAAFGDDLPFYYIHYITYGKNEGRNAKERIGG